MGGGGNMAGNIWNCSREYENERADLFRLSEGTMKGGVYWRK